MRIDSNQKRAMAIVLAALGAVGGLLWYPAYRDIRKLSAELERIDAQLRENRGKVIGLSDLSQQVGNIESEIRTGRKVIPRQGELSEFLRELSERLQSSRLSEASVSTKPTIDGPGYVTMPIGISFTGDSRAAYAFIKQLENMPQLVQVTGLRFNTDKDAGATVQASLDLNTFYYPAKEGTP